MKKKNKSSIESPNANVLQIEQEKRAWKQHTIVLCRVRAPLTWYII